MFPYRCVICTTKWANIWERDEKRRDFQRGPKYCDFFYRTGTLYKPEPEKSVHNGVLKMGVLNVFSVVLLVVFIIIAILLVLLVLVQNEEGDSLGGIFAGGSASAFGSRSGNVLTRTTTVLGALFLIISLGLALLNRTPGDAGVESAGQQLLRESGGTPWLDEELNARTGAETGAAAGETAETLRGDEAAVSE
jgi:preprotein translocase subunit SecG